MTTATDIDAALAVQDYRQRVLNREPIQAHEYRALINLLTRNRESRAAAAAASSKERRKAERAPAKPIDLKTLFTLSAAPDAP